MLDLSDLRFLSALSAAPSLATAARALSITPPAVSQRLALLENRLRLRLIERGRGKPRLTAEGAYLVDRAKDILDEVESLSDDMSARAGRIEGPLHVIAPFGFGRLRVARSRLQRMPAHRPARRQGRQPDSLAAIPQLSHATS